MPIWPTQPISNAADLTLDQQPGTLPDMSGTVAGWFQNCYFEQVTKVVNENAVVEETTTPVQFQGVVQPLSPKQLSMKPEGQRAWTWLKVHAWPQLKLVPDDVVRYQGVQYRVMAQTDYTSYGYVEYDLAQDYTGSGPTEVP